VIKIKLQIEVIQLNVTQGDFEKNLELMEEHINNRNSKSKLLVFPQYTITGYPTFKILDLLSNNFDYIISKICGMAKRYKTGLLFSIPKSIGNNLFQDQILYINKEGVIETTYIRIKKFWREDNCITGNKIQIIVVDNIKIGIIAGDDIYYPEISNQLSKNGVNCIICLFYNAKRNLCGNHFDLGYVLKSLVTSLAVINEIDFVLCSATGIIDHDDNQSIIAGATLVGNSMMASISESKEIFTDNDKNSFVAVIDDCKLEFYRMINRRN